MSDLPVGSIRFSSRAAKSMSVIAEAKQLTEKEIQAIKTARVAATGDVEELLAIIDRLTGTSHHWEGRE